MSTLAGQPPLAFVRRPRGHARCVAAVWMLTVALTAAGVLLGRLVPALPPDGTPHATLYGSADEGAGILLPNLRVLAASVILADARWAEDRATRLLATRSSPRSSSAARSRWAPR